MNKRPGQRSTRAPNGALAHWTCALLMLLPTIGTAWAEAQPVFSSTGPDAAAYGAAQDYPLGAPGPAMNSQPFIVGSYSHYDEILKARIVSRGAKASVFSRAPQELALAYSHRGSPQTIETYLERHPATGLLVARDRTILYEHYRYGRTDAQRLTSQSMAKTITSMLVGIAISEGAIGSLDDAASIYVPELAGSALGAAPIRALLHMASGIAFSLGRGSRCCWPTTARGTACK